MLHLFQQEGSESRDIKGGWWLTAYGPLKQLFGRPAYVTIVKPSRLDRASARAPDLLQRIACVQEIWSRTDISIGGNVALLAAAPTGGGLYTLQARPHEITEWSFLFESVQNAVYGKIRYKISLRYVTAKARVLRYFSSLFFQVTFKPEQLGELSILRKQPCENSEPNDELQSENGTKERINEIDVKIKKRRDAMGNL